MLFGFCVMTALLKLSQISGPVSSRLESICLPEQAATSPFASGPCIATGWGQASRTGPLTAKLLEARIPLQENAVCRSKYGNSVPIRAGHLCAGHLDGSTGTCVVSGNGWYGCAGVLGVCVCVCDADSYPDYHVLDVLFMNIQFHGSELCIFIIFLDLGNTRWSLQYAYAGTAASVNIAWCLHSFIPLKPK